MAWQDKLRGSFGRIDNLFCNHDLDTERAREMLQEAIVAGVSWGDIEKEARNILTARNCAQDHVDEQIRAMRDLSSYFPSKE